MLFPLKPLTLDKVTGCMTYGHSTLNANAYNHGLTDSNLCRCGSKEDREHFFFGCPIYATPHVVLLKSVADLICPGVNYIIFFLLHMGKNHLLNILLYDSGIVKG